MNLVNTFTRIKKLFFRREGKTLRLVEINEHMRRDLGLDGLNHHRHTHDAAFPREGRVIYGHLTRAP